MKALWLNALWMLAVAMTAQAAPPPITVLVDGSELPTSEGNRVERVLVEQVLDGPDFFSIDLKQSKKSPPDIDSWAIGMEVEIKIGGSAAETIFKGEISALEPIYPARGRAKVVVSGFNKLHRLTRGRKSKTYSDTSDAEIVSVIAARNGLVPETEDNGLRHAFVYQHNQTDLEFLRQRAQRIGYLVAVQDDLLRFVKRPDPNSPPATVISEFPSLLNFKLSRKPGPVKVEVRGWDPVNKQPITGSAEHDPNAPGEGDETVIDRADPISEGPLLSQGLISSPQEADALAKALLNQQAGQFIRGSGQVAGLPQLQAGQLVEFTGIGDRFNGKYFVVGVTHEMGKRVKGGYTTKFDVRRTGFDD